jgi:hypothetical protein
MPEYVFSSHHGILFSPGFGCQPENQSVGKSPSQDPEVDAVLPAEKH